MHIEGQGGDLPLYYSSLAIGLLASSRLDDLCGPGNYGSRFLYSTVRAASTLGTTAVPPYWTVSPHGGQHQPGDATNEADRNHSAWGRKYPARNTL